MIALSLSCNFDYLFSKWQPFYAGKPVKTDKHCRHFEKNNEISKRQSGNLLDQV